jgi:transcriptional regulator with XRE-family HTH domain
MGCMTGEELQRTRLALGLTLDEFARLVRVSSGRTVRKWEDGERDVPGPVAVLAELFLLSSDAWRCRCGMNDMADAFRCRCR